MKYLQDRSNDVTNAIKDLTRNRGDDPQVAREVLKNVLIALNSIETTHSPQTDNLLAEAEAAVQELQCSLS